MAGKNEQIVVEVTDGVDSTIQPKLKGIADQSRKAYDQVTRLQAQLNKLNAGGLSKLQTAMDRGTASVQRQALANEKLATQAARTAAAQNNAAVAAGRVAAQNERTAAAAARAGVATEKLATAQQRTAQAAANTANAQARAAQAQSNAAAAAARAEAANTRAAVTQEKLNKAQHQTATSAAQAAAAQTRAATAAQSLATAQQRTQQATLKTAAAQQTLNSATARAVSSSLGVTTAQQKLAAATNLASAAMNRNATAATQASAAQARMAAQAAQAAQQQQILANRTAQSAASAQAAQLRLQRLQQGTTGATNRATQAQTQNNKQARYGALTYKQYEQAMRGIPAQMTDIVVSLQGGQAPLTVLLQQGGQLKDMFGGIVPAIRALSGAFLTLLLKPIVLVTAAIGALVFAFAKAESATRTLNGQLARLGATGRSEIGADFLGSLRQQLEDLPNMGRKSANGVLDAFISVRTIGGPMMEQLTKIVGDFGVAAGKDTVAAAEDLAKAFGEPLKGAKMLDEQLGFLTVAQIKSIAEFEKQGKTIEAQQVMYDALAARVQGLQENALTPLQRSTRDLGVQWNELKRALDDSGVISKVEQMFIAVVNAVTWVIEKFTKLITMMDSWSPPAWLDTMMRSGPNSWFGMGDFFAGGPRNTGGASASWGDPVAPKPVKTPTSMSTELKWEKAGLSGKKPKVDRTEEKRAAALAKVNLQLDNEIRLLGVVGPLREQEEKFNQISEQLISKKIDLNKKEYESTKRTIQEKIRAIVEGAEQQRQMDRIYEEAVGPMREYTATQKAATDLLKDGRISQAEYNKQLAKSKEEYLNTINPMREYNMQMQQEMTLASIMGPQRDIVAKLMEKENELRAEGLSLTQEQTVAMAQELEALRQKQMVQSEYNRILDETANAQESLNSRTTALNMAYQNGLMTLDQYQIRMNRLKVEQANLATATGIGTWEDAAIGAVGRVISSYEGMFSGLSSVFGDFMNNMTDGFANSIGQWIMGAKSLREALYDVATQALSQLIAGLVKVGIQYALNAALGTSMAATMTAANVALAATVATAWAPAAALVSLASFGTNSIAAATALTTTTALAEGIAAMAGGFKSGGYTGNIGPDDVAGVVHGREYVFDAKSTSRIGVGNLMALQSGAELGGSGRAASEGRPVGGTNLNVTVKNEYGPEVDFEVRQLTESDVEVIAKRVVSKETDMLVAQNLTNPNSKSSRALARNTTTSRRYDG